MRGMSGRPWHSIQHQGAQRAPPDLYDLLWLRHPVKISGRTVKHRPAEAGLDSNAIAELVGWRWTGDSFLFT